MLFGAFGILIILFYALGRFRTYIAGQLLQYLQRIHHSAPRPQTDLTMQVTRKEPQPIRPKRIVVAMTGATGSALAVKLLERLRDLDVETHLVISRWAELTNRYETDTSLSGIRKLATHVYSINDQAAAISSGSFQHDGMVVIPCSMKTVAAIRCGLGQDLISRAADVSIKEQRRLVLAVRETPLSAIHLDNLSYLAHLGVTIFPPMPAFYTRPKTIDDIHEQSIGRLLDLMGIHLDTFERWNGPPSLAKPDSRTDSNLQR